jgi:hypothetical protein
LKGNMSADMKAGGGLSVKDAVLLVWVLGPCCWVLLLLTDVEDADVVESLLLVLAVVVTVVLVVTCRLLPEPLSVVDADTIWVLSPGLLASAAARRACMETATAGN